MKLNLSLILTLFFSLHISSEDQIFLVDIIFIKYLPESQTNETFLPPELSEIDNILFLSDFPYPEIEIKSLPLDLGYRFQDLFMSVQIDDENQNLLEEEQIPHNLLNAKPENVQREAEIVAQAGRSGAVTIATNMAGRGTDIILGGNSDYMSKLKIKELLSSRFIKP